MNNYLGYFILRRVNNYLPGTCSTARLQLAGMVDADKLVKEATAEKGKSLITLPSL